MKKVFLTALTLLLTVSLVGCSTSHDDNQEQP